jgi:oxaloacetate decarboxylase (Na+ extruding) subunit gamma
MPVTEMLMSGVNLMIIGMGIVFIFLLVLVFVMKGMSKLAVLLEPQGGGEALSHQPAATTQGEDGMRGDLIAVIGAAVSRYRASHR